mmetsp:Transcript_92548/g.299227  ORF Transcript_92548/g.299227 Transcript_92548/m.299227 type:complete len:97 (+) Transcript_92548:1883-2173(+)
MRRERAKGSYIICPGHRELGKMGLSCMRLMKLHRMPSPTCTIGLGLSCTRSCEEKSKEVEQLAWPHVSRIESLNHQSYGRAPQQKIMQLPTEQLCS